MKCLSWIVVLLALGGCIADPVAVYLRRQRAQLRAQRERMIHVPIRDVDASPWDKVQPICEARYSRRAEELKYIAEARVNSAAAVTAPALRARIIERTTQQVLMDAENTLWVEWKRCLAEYGWTLKLHR